MNRILGAAALAAVVVSAVGQAEAQQAAPVVDKKAAKEAEKRMRELRRQYGEGPYPDDIAAYVGARPAPLQPLYRLLYTQGEAVAVLNFERLAVAAMELGYYKDAEYALDQAIDRIEAIYAKDAQAEKARSTFRMESNKDYKGEPYERAMAYYYRGLPYLRAGDYENARASFLTAEFQDTMSEAETYQSDFAVMNYLAGWSSHCLGQEAKAGEAYVDARKGNDRLAPADAAANTLFIGELGLAPLKVKGGNQKELLTFEEAEDADAEDGLTFAVAGETQSTVTVKSPARGKGKAAPPPQSRTVSTPFALEFHPLLASSVWEQASTRGGKPVQGILNGKAQFKGATGAVGDAAIAVGTAAAFSNNSTLAQSSPYLQLAGMLFKAASSAAKADADVRAWDNLPGAIHLATGSLPTATFQTTAHYSSHEARLSLTGAPVMQASAGRCAIVWTRAHTALLDRQAPGIDEGVMRSRAKAKDAIAKDKAFRAALQAAATPAQTIQTASNGG